MNRIIATILIAAFLAFPVTASASEAQQLRQYKAQVKELKAEKAKYRKLYVKYRQKHLRRTRVWSKSAVRFTVQAAGEYHKLPQKEIDRLKVLLIDAIYRLPGKPACESSGDTRMRNGKYLGILSIEPWKLGPKLSKRAKKLGHKHPKAGWRHCGECSIYRIVGGYKKKRSEGGPAHAERWLRDKFPTIGR